MSGSPIRLLLVTDSYPPFIGGADRQIQMIARAMRDRGHRVQVATLWQVGLAELEEDDGVTVHRLRSLTTRVSWFSKDPRRRNHPPYPDPMMVIGLRRLVRRFAPDVVHTYGWISYSAAAALLGSPIPLIVSARDYGNVCAVRNLLYFRGYVCDLPAPMKCLRCAAFTYTQDDAGNAVLGGADAGIGAGNRIRGGGKALVAVAGVYFGRPLLRRKMKALHSNSAFVRSVMDRHLVGGLTGARPDVIRTVIPSFLPEDEPGSADAQVLQALPAEPFILFVGALLPQKGIWPLLAGYQRLRDAPPLVLLGPRAHNSPRTFPRGVIALGPVSNRTVLAAWDRALFGVVPSVCAETFGNVVTEAMTRGRAVIASRLGGIVDIIEDGVSGLLVPAGDAAALAAAMERLLEDTALRDALGTAARERVQRFSAARVLPRFAELYRTVASGERRRDEMVSPLP